MIKDLTKTLYPLMKLGHFVQRISRILLVEDISLSKLPRKLTTQKTHILWSKNCPKNPKLFLSEYSD